MAAFWLRFCEINDDAPEAGNAIRPFRRINKVVEAKNSSEFIIHDTFGLCNNISNFRYVSPVNQSAGYRSGRA